MLPWRVIAGEGRTTKKFDVRARLKTRNDHRGLQWGLARAGEESHEATASAFHFGAFGVSPFSAFHLRSCRNTEWTEFTRLRITPMTREAREREGFAGAFHTLRLQRRKPLRFLLLIFQWTNC